MSPEAIEKGTGAPLAAWIELIEKSGKSDLSHKEIADFLHDQGASYWWAQEITVEYERHIGRRVVGQTHDGTFQLGVTRSVRASCDSVWSFLNSRSGLKLIFGRSLPPGATGLHDIDGTAPDGVVLTTTTFVPGSHARIRWEQPAGDTHSILQIRVTPRDGGKAAVTFHHEKLDSLAERDRLKSRWRDAAQAISEKLSPRVS